MRRVGVLVLLAVIVGCGGGSGLTAADRAACDRAAADASDGFRQLQIDLSTSSFDSIRSDEQVVSGEIADDAAGLDDGSRVKGPLMAWSQAYASASNYSGASLKGTRLIQAGLDGAAKVCPDD